MHVLDLMIMCWSHDQTERPSAREICEIATSPAFSHLRDVTSLHGQVDVISAASSPVVLETDSDTGEVFGESRRVRRMVGLRKPQTVPFVHLSKMFPWGELQMMAMVCRLSAVMCPVVGNRAKMTTTHCKMTHDVRGSGACLQSHLGCVQLLHCPVLQV